MKSRRTTAVQKWWFPVILLWSTYTIRQNYNLLEKGFFPTATLPLSKAFLPLHIAISRARNGDEQITVNFSEHHCRSGCLLDLLELLSIRSMKKTRTSSRCMRISDSGYRVFVDNGTCSVNRNYLSGRRSGREQELEVFTLAAPLDQDLNVLRTWFCASWVHVLGWWPGGIGYKAWRTGCIYHLDH